MSRFGPAPLGVVLAVVGLLVAATGFAAAGLPPFNAPLGYVTSFDGKDTILDGEIAFQIDQHFQDGSPGDGVVTSNIVVVATQCYGGEFVGNFNATSGEEVEGGITWDPAGFTNATVLSGSGRLQKTLYGLFHDDVALGLQPGRTAADVFNQGQRGFLTQQLENPSLTGDGTRTIGGASSTHVLVYVSNPITLDRGDITAITNAFPEGPNQTVTVLAGDGTPGQGTAAVDGAATKTNLFQAIQTIGALMDDGPDEQFILFIGDHGGFYHTIAPLPVPAATVSPPATGFFTALFDVPRDELSVAVTRVLTEPNGPNPVGRLLLLRLQQAGVDPNSLLIDATLGTSPPAPVCPTLEVGPLLMPPGPPKDTFGCDFDYELLSPDNPFLADPAPVDWALAVGNTNPFAIDFEALFASSGARPRLPEPDHPAALVDSDPDYCQCGAYDPNRPIGFGTDKRLDPGDGASGFQGLPGSQTDADGPRPPAFPGMPSDSRSFHCDPADGTAVRYRFQGDGTGAMTVMGFVQPDGLFPASLLTRGSETSGGASWKLGIDADGYPELTISPDGSLDLSSTSLRSHVAVPAGEWTHLAATYDPNGGIAIYQDGRQTAHQTFAVPDQRFETSDPFEICGDGASNGLDGRIGHVSYVARSLSESEIAELFQSALGFGGQSAFGFDWTLLGDTQMGLEAGGSIGVRGAGPSGADGASAFVKDADVENQGLHVDYTSTLRDLSGGTAVFFACGVKTVAGPVLGGLIGAQYTGASEIAVADFSSLGASIVGVTVLDDGAAVTGFTALNGAVATAPASADPVGTRVLPSATGFGYELHFDADLPFTPASGGGPFIGDALRVEPGSSIPAITEVSNCDVLAIDTDVSLTHVDTAPRPQPLPEDVNGDGCVDQEDIQDVVRALLSAGLGATEGLDVDGNGIVDIHDALRIRDAFTDPNDPCVLNSFTGPASLAPPVGPTPLAPWESGATSGAAPAAVTLSLDLSNATPVVGEMIEVEVALSGLAPGAAPTLAGLLLEVLYDPALFALRGATISGSLGSADTELGHEIASGAEMAGLVFDTPGVVSVYAISLLSAAALDALQVGDFPVVTLTFEALGVGSASFTPSAVQLADNAGAVLPAALQGAQATVGPAPIPAVGGALLLSLGVVLLIAIWAGAYSQRAAAR